LKNVVSSDGFHYYVVFVVTLAVSYLFRRRRRRRRRRRCRDRGRGHGRRRRRHRPYRRRRRCWHLVLSNGTFVSVAAIDFVSAWRLRCVKKHVFVTVATLVLVGALVQTLVRNTSENPCQKLVGVRNLLSPILSSSETRRRHFRCHFHCGRLRLRSRSPSRRRRRCRCRHLIGS
jgi:hypothetical protein